MASNLPFSCSHVVVYPEWCKCGKYNKINGGNMNLQYENSTLAPNISNFMKNEQCKS